MTCFPQAIRSRRRRRRRRRIKEEEEKEAQNIKIWSLSVRGDLREQKKRIDHKRKKRWRRKWKLKRTGVKGSSGRVHLDVCMMMMMMIALVVVW